jgi:cytochrome c oxidase cbb3-type subunit 4
MDTYSLLREIADSWVLLAMFCFFVGAGIWAFLPSLSDARMEASLIPLREDTDAKACENACENCACAAITANLEGARHD